jgi:hypothetical protein
MSLGDVIKNFETLSVNHSDPTYTKRLIPADIEGSDAPSEQASSSNSQWGVFHVKTRFHYPHAFFRIHQLEL